MSKHTGTLSWTKNHWQCCRNPGDWPRLRLSRPFEILWCHISGQSPGLGHNRDLPQAYHNSKLLKTKTVQNIARFLVKHKKIVKYAWCHSNTYRSHMISKQAFSNSLVHTGLRSSTHSNTRTLIRKRGRMNSFDLETLMFPLIANETIQYLQRLHQGI